MDDLLYKTLICHFTNDSDLPCNNLNKTKEVTLKYKL